MIKYADVYKAVKEVTDALEKLRDVAEKHKRPNLYAVAQLVFVDVIDAAHDDGVIG